MTDCVSHIHVFQKLHLKVNSMLSFLTEKNTLSLILKPNAEMQQVQACSCVC